MCFYSRSNYVFIRQIKIETVTFFVFFGDRKMGTSVYALRVLLFCDVGITPLTHAWLALHPWSGKRASKIDIARMLSSAKASVCFSFRYLVFIFVLICHHKVRKPQSNDSMEDAMQPASYTACAWRQVVQLISKIVTCCPYITTSLLPRAW